MMKYILNKEILKEVFYCLSGALAIFVVAELIFPNIILAYFNPNLGLILWLIVGIMIVTIDNK